MLPVFIKRGPWASIQAISASATPRATCITSLSELPDALDGHDENIQTAFE